MWAPELHPERLLETAAVAELAGVDPRTISKYLADQRIPAPQAGVGGSPLWARPIIAHWLAHRPGRGAGGGRPRKQQAP